jgi:hypothetical protein
VNSKRPRTRSLLIVAGIAVMLSVIHAVDGPPVSGASKRDRNVDRAVASYEAMQEYLYIADRSLYTEEYPNGDNNPYSYVWPFSQAMAATIDLAGIRSTGAAYGDDVADRFEGVELYWNSETARPSASAATSSTTTTSGSGSSSSSGIG